MKNSSENHECWEEGQEFAGADDESIAKEGNTRVTFENAGQLSK